jgi:beta-glucanase (GH16 family)
MSLTKRLKTDMRYFYLLSILLLSGFSIAQTPPSDPNWNLVWSDDFNGNSINTNIWSVANYDDGNGELEVYIDNPNNVFVSNGYLNLHVMNQTVTCPNGAPGCVYPNHGYTSGKVESTLPYYMKFGYIEARIKISSDRPGLWPAFWLFTGNFPNAPYNEIDIFEMVPGQKFGYIVNPFGNAVHDKYKMTTNYHLSSPGQDGNVNMEMNGVADYTNYHTYAVEWSPTYIVWYVDGQVIRKTVNHSVDDIPLKVILNVALATIPGGIPQPVFESMYVDYVKVYELKKNCNAYINSYLYNFLTYDNIAKNFINIGGQGSNNVVPAGSSTHLRASDHVEIDGEFEVPLNTLFFMEASGDCGGNVITPGTCNNTFNPCNYNFNTYDNLVRQFIVLGDFCPISIINNAIMLDFKATDEIDLKNETSLTPTQTNDIELRITSCQ